MRQFGAFTVPVMLTALLAACATQGHQPELRNAALTPDVLNPGDGALLTAEVVNDAYGVVSTIEGTIQDDPRVSFNLNDNGERGDVTAGDGVWSLDMEVPFQAPPGEFVIVLTAYDDNGQIIPVLSPQGDSVPLTAACSLVIQYAEE